MKIPFREHHLFQLFQLYDKERLPLDLVIFHYFRQNKALGSKDRGTISEWAYHLMRWKLTFDYFIQSPNPTWKERFEISKEIDLKGIQKNEEIPLQYRLSFPEDLLESLIKSLGKEVAIKFCLNSNQPAPTTIRINPLKTTREELLKKFLAQGFQVKACKFSSFGINFEKKISLFSLPEFKEGLFEVQDEGSQLLADLMKVKAHDLVLDWCAGSGGKSLAFAHKMEKTGQIYLHDIRKKALVEAKKRLKRAGIQNAQTIEWQAPYLKKLKGKMDWVLVDAPCSGTGTYRRNPDMKWKFGLKDFASLKGEQRMIFEKALSFVRPKGYIVWATCSVLKDENFDQIEHFQSIYPLELVEDPFLSLPSPGGMDGFFGATLKKIG